ncbi:MAG: AAA family ATPase, partial [Planctomycetota bacterium]|nr:AAA family ATPase [Planctomycetota bacterium]
SNNSVQDARDLIANASVLPARAPYKIYIIDEVHMLSTAAFNALLKTMEEPPAHVKFILCTTEPHKVLPTIQSRCQRFDFRPISVPRIAEHLRNVLASESIEADEPSIARVARLANGSMRDGLSILERLVAAADGAIDAALLERVIGVPPEDRVAEAVAAIGAGDVAGALQATASLLGEGLPAERVLDGLAERFRRLLVASTCGADPTILEAAAAEAEALVEESRVYEPTQLVHLVALCDAAAQRVRTSTVPRAIVDAVVARMALSERFVEAASLLNGTDPSPKKKSLKSAEPVGSTGSAARRATAPPARSPDPATAPAPTAEPTPEPTPEASPAPIPVASPKTRPPKDATAPDPASTVEGVDWASDHDDSARRSLGPWASLQATAGTPRQRAMLEDFEFERLEGGLLVLRRRDDASPGVAYVMQHPQGLEDLASTAFGRRMKVEFVQNEPAAGRQDRVPVEDEARAAMEHPLVREAMELFDAHVVEVRRLPEPTPSNSPTQEKED